MTSNNGNGSICQDDTFGPTVVGCRGDFDFTLLFEQSFLSIAPSSILILLSLLRIRFLWTRRRFVTGTYFQVGKVVAIVCYGVVQLALLVLWATQARDQARTAVAAAALSFIDVFALSVLSWLEHGRSPRPSAVLNTYLLFSILFDIVQTRTLWLKEFNNAIQILFSLSLAMKVCLLVLEAVQKEVFLPKEWAARSPEEKAGVINQSLLVWLRGILLQGGRRLISMDDLALLHGDLASAPLASTFWTLWKKQSQPVRPRAVAYLLLWSLKWPFLAPVLPRLAQIAFTLCQPLLLQRLLNLLQGDGTQNDGYGLIGAYALIYFGIAISSCFYWRLVYRSLVQMRGCLVAVIYQKTLEIDTAHYDMSAPVALMSTDIERIIKGMTDMHEIWANALQVGIAIWLLYNQLGVACVAPAACAAVFGVAATAMSARADRYQVTWSEATQKRVGVTADAIASMKGIRFLGLSTLIYETIRKLRVDELRSARNFRYVEVLTATIAFAPLLLSPVFTFLIFVAQAHNSGQALDSSKIFTSISLLQLATQPLVWLFQAIPAFVASTGCLSRIGAYLLALPRSERREFDESFTKRTSSERSTPSSGLTQTSEKDLGSNKKDCVAIDVRRSVSNGENEAVDFALQIKDGSFGWSAEKPVLTGINISVPVGQITIIVGPVACGKSTLCRALIGELPFVQGKIHVKSGKAQIAYCDQQPFLQNASLRQNIVGFSGLDQTWYDTVMQATGLKTDLNTLSEGDQTRVGSRGVSLSGGQRQRVSIARALYSRCSILVFDDVLSGLDALTKEHVFQNVFGPKGLIKQNGFTAVLCTHDADLLPEADHIIALGSSGQIQQSGNFAQLSQTAGYISSLSIRRAQKDEAGQELDRVKEEQESSSNDALLEELAKEEAALLEDQSRRLGDIGVFKFFFSAIGAPSILIFFFYQFGWAVFSTIGNVWLNKWSAANEAGSGNDGYYLGVYAAFQSLGLIFLALFAGFTLTTVAVKAGTRLHTVSLDTVINAPISFFTTVDVGVTTNRFSQDINLIDADLPLALLETVSAGLVAIVQMILIAVASPFVAISYPFIIGILYFVQKFYLRTSRQLRFLDLEAKSPLYTHFLETVNGLATIRSFGWSSENVLLNHEKLDDSQRPLYLLYMVQRWLQLVLDSLTMVMAVILVGVAVSLPPASTGFIGVALVNLMSINQELKMIVIQWTSLETSLGAVSRTKSFKETTPTEHDECETIMPLNEWPQAGGIEIDSLSGSYNTEDKAHFAFQDVSVSIRPGEKIAVCGRSGSGKSSLVMTFARMVELVHGSVKIDGTDLSTLDRTTVRRRLNVIPQEFFHLDDTVSRNLDPFDLSSQEEMKTVLQKVAMWSIVESAGGLGGRLNFSTLSHGQKQKFALARAILHRSNIVILDEATSDVDQETDALMQKTIRQEFQGKTILAVAHRLNTIMDFDRVMVMQAGRLIECGPPRELLEADTVFKQLCVAQGVGYE